MRENGLQAAARMGSPRGPRNHDGTIIPETIDTMWGTDMTAAFTVEHRQVAVFITSTMARRKASASVPRAAAQRSIREADASGGSGGPRSTAPGATRSSRCAKR